MTDIALYDINISRLFRDNENTEFVTANHQGDYIDFEFGCRDENTKRILCIMSIDVDSKAHYGVITASETDDFDFNEEAEADQEQLAVMLASLPEKLSPVVVDGKIDYDAWIEKVEDAMEASTAPAF